MFAIILKLPSSLLHLVIKTIVSFITWRIVRAAVAHYGIILIFQWPVVTPHKALFFNHYKQNLRVNTVFLRDIINNLRSTLHASSRHALRFIQSLMGFWIFIVFIDTNIWRIVILSLTIFLSHNLRISSSCRSCRYFRSIWVSPTCD